MSGGTSGPGRSQGPSAETRALEGRAWQPDSSYFWLSLGILVLGILLRFLFLDSDPAYGFWHGYIQDEGRWIEQARRLVLFGALDFDGWYSRVHLAIAPGYQTVTTILFAIFGVGFTSARMTSALSGSLLLIGAFVLLRARLSKVGLIFVLLALALHPDLVFLGRLAIPESAALLFEFFAFAVIVSSPLTCQRAFTAGILSAAGLAMKATIAPVIPIFALVVATQPTDPAASASWRKPALAYASGFLIPTLLALVPVALLVDPNWMSISEDLQVVLNLAGFRSVRELTSMLFLTPALGNVHALVLGAWGIAGILLCVGEIPHSSARDLYYGSTIWAVGWLTLALPLEYFPPRYVFHVIVPLALSIGAGLTLLSQIGKEAVMASFGKLNSKRRVLLSVWFALPAVILVAPLVLSSLVDPASVSYRPLRHHVRFILTLTLISSAALFFALRRSKGLVIFVLEFPLVALPLWFILARLGIMDPTFWGPPGRGPRVGWVILLASASLISLLLRAGTEHAPVRRLALSGYLIVVSCVWLGSTVPRLLKPTYTLQQASHTLGTTIDRSATVGTGWASAVFMENRLSYVEHLGNTNEVLPQVFVSYGPIFQELEAAYRLVSEHEINQGPTPPDSSYSSIGVYRRR